MEDALALPSIEMSYTNNRQVLILVLMEDALARSIYGQGDLEVSGLNPCSNGRCTRTPENKAVGNNGYQS